MRTLCVLATVLVVCVAAGMAVAQEPVQAPMAPTAQAQWVPGVPAPTPVGCGCAPAYCTLRCAPRCYTPYYPSCYAAPCAYPVWRPLIYRPWRWAAPCCY